MSTPRLPMRRIREVLRLKHERGVTHREVAQACSISIGGSVATFGITRESPLGGPRYTANPNTLWISRV